MRHSFAIESLGRRPGWFAPSSYRYYCVRCHWMFLVQGSKVCALNDSSTPLPELENGRRTATFAIGPCPAVPPECLPPTRGSELPSSSQNTSRLVSLIGRFRRSEARLPAATNPSSPNNVVYLENATQARAAIARTYVNADNVKIPLDADKNRRSHIRMLPRPPARSEPSQG
jgi:hypothetical protein